MGNKDRFARDWAPGKNVAAPILRGREPGSRAGCAAFKLADRLSCKGSVVDREGGTCSGLARAGEIRNPQLRGEQVALGDAGKS